KMQRSAQRVNNDTTASKRQSGTQQAGPPTKGKKPMKKEVKVSELTKRHLIVAIIYRGDPNCKMTEA
ncbi:hypothetical protein KR038_009090, partial [Drosophila bunnanda]